MGRLKFGSITNRGPQKAILLTNQSPQESIIAKSFRRTEQTQNGCFSVESCRKCAAKLTQCSVVMWRSYFRSVRQHRSLIGHFIRQIPQRDNRFHGFQPCVSIHKIPLTETYGNKESPERSVQVTYSNLRSKGQRVESPQQHQYISPSSLPLSNYKIQADGT